MRAKTRILNCIMRLKMQKRWRDLRTIFALILRVLDCYLGGLLDSLMPEDSHKQRPVSGSELGLIVRQRATALQGCYIANWVIRLLLMTTLGFD